MVARTPCQTPWTVDPQGFFRIFLHKHLFDNAIAVLKMTTRYTLVAPVVDATLEEQTALDWVIQALPAEHIMNDLVPGSRSLAHKSTYGYSLRGHDEAWHVYLHHLLERQQHPSKFLPLLMAL